MNYTPFLRAVARLKAYSPLAEMMSRELRLRCSITARKLAAHHKRSGPFRVVFCGVFSSGKTSLINTLLRSGGVLPTGICPITKVITHIRYGPELTCACIQDGQRKRLDAETALRVVRGECAVPGGGSEIFIEMPAEILKENVEFLDTPGFEDEMGGRLEEMTRSAIAAADFAVVCCSAAQLGKLFERGFLEETDRCMGNFCMVVSRMDHLNTEQDRQDVAKKAEALMGGRGNAAGIRGCTGRYFLTSMEPHRRDLGGFGRYISAIFRSAQAKALIRRSTDDVCVASCTDELKLFLNAHLEQLVSSYEQLEEENRQEIEEAEQEAEMERLKFQNTASDAWAAANTFAEHRTEEYSRQVRGLAVPASFKDEAEILAREVLSGLIDDIAQYGADRGIAPRGKIRASLQRGCGEIAIPEPQGHWVQNRGIVACTLITALSFLVLEPELDDGYDWEYYDFHEPAVRAVRSGPMEQVLGQWRQFLQDIQNMLDAVSIDEDPVLLDQMSNLAGEIRQCTEIRELLRHVGMSPDR